MVIQSYRDLEAWQVGMSFVEAVYDLTRLFPREELFGLTAQLRNHPGIFLAGQITGVEGYLESAAIGIVAGLNAHRQSIGLPAAILPRETALGSLCHYLVETNPKRFGPMNANFGIMPELPEPIRDKREKARRKGEQALAAIDRFRLTLESAPATAA